MVDRETILKAFYDRHATKKFRSDRAISDEDFELILEAARLSPSSYGFEPWNIIVVEDKEIVKEIIEAGAWGAKKPGRFADRFVVMTAKRDSEMQPYNSVHIDYVVGEVIGEDEEETKDYHRSFKEWLENDFNLTQSGLIHQWCARQAYIALGNMITVAALRGIDSCPIEGFSIERTTELLSRYGVLDPDKDLPVVMVAFGFRAGPIPKKTRRTIEEIVTKL